ncbi:energy transducer TonB [Parasediminibacterium sp. JCM 36343]|uniref:energy transducer TonB n=1 Tax=Parasediminibacterium sp. JCM 36343 TaxID=3374279 RepID=UPI0039787823
MEVNKILSADILDIIFDGKNKEYGAYELRKSYNKRITYAMLTTIAIILLIFIGSILASSFKKNTKNEIIVQDVSLEDVKKDEKKPEPPPPPPPPKQEPPKVEITKFTPPKIVKDEEVKEPPPEVAKMEDTKIGTINQEGAKDEGVVAPPVESKGTGVVEAPKQEEDYDKVFTSVQIVAEFPGGQAAWVKYLQKNLNNNLPADNSAPPGKYTVVVSFIVDKNGNISDVVAENDPKYGTAEEAVRVIKKGPAWKPAVQNGRNVTYRARQAITFMVADE